jgi:DNA-binding response OmpR family regulator/HPt (histidine-containing phosphotransfer) domain-containing protein
MKILLIEDDDALISLLTRSLNTHHHIVDAVKDGESGWTYASTFDYDLIVLDIMLPKLDGISLCQRLRQEGYTTPILLLTAQDLITAKIQGLDAGADDYVVKPFDLNELMARVRALLRRSSNNPLPLLSWGDLLLNPSTCDVTYDGQPLTLTTKEYDLLELLLRDSYHVFSSDEIIDRLWSSDAFPAEATVRSHLRRLRHKLQAAGAPQDFISTIHGRGYYLKSPDVNRTFEISIAPSEDRRTANISNFVSEGHRDLPFHSQPEQYLAFLQETWVATQPQCLERIADIQTTIDRLLRGDCTYPEQQQAHHQAHKLVGTLGVFSLISAMTIARKLENLLDRPHLLSPTEAALLSTLSSQLQQEIDRGEPTQTIEIADAHRPLLLLVDLDPSLTLSLTTIAGTRNCQILTLSSIEAAYSYLSTIPDFPPHLLAPTVVLVSLSTNLGSNPTPHPLLGFINNIHRRFPHWAVLVLAENDGLNDRLAVVRNGGKFIATAGLNIEQVFFAATSVIQTTPINAKVMVVDDDVDWLMALPQLLQPWGMQVTTLADPQQFLTVLQTIQPDVLVLDIKMPEMDGLELCQVLRNDPQWQRLPILFLSGMDRALAEQEAFNVGADDYLSKPVMGSELAHRIRHRLNRIQAGQGAT